MIKNEFEACWLFSVTRSVLFVSFCMAFSGLHAADWDFFDWKVPPPASPAADAQHFTPEEREHFFPRPEYEPDFRGINRDRIRPMPAPGVHPRLMITPDDLPEIRERIQTSQAAGIAYKKLVTDTANFDDEANTDMKALIDGSATVELINGGPDSDGEGARIRLTSELAANALRALLDEDEERGRRVAAALTTYGRLAREHVEARGYIGLYRPLKNMSLAYDYAAPFMTDAQRAEVRGAMALALTRPYHHLDGAMYGVGHPRPSHNWVSLVTQYIMQFALVIEGEDPGIEGMDAGYITGAVDAMLETSERWIHYFWGENGASMEGMGKNQLNAMVYIPLARRGNWLIAHPHVRRAIDSFYPAILQPWGYRVINRGGWGGGENNVAVRDVIAMKWIAPKDPVVDFMYRNAVGEAYENLTGMDVIMAVDWSGPKDWEAHGKQSGASLNFLDARRAMLSARTAWEKDATWLQFVTEQAWTAHKRNEIATFAFSAMGVRWGDYISAYAVSRGGGNMVMIDGFEAGSIGRMVSASTSDAAAFATADWAYGFNGYVEPGDPNPTINDFQVLNPFEAPFADMKDRFHWQNPWRKIPASEDREINSPYPVEHAYRTVGLVRGSSPYALIIDDIRKGEGRHLFEWYMQTPADMAVVSMNSHELDDFSFEDMILTREQDIIGSNNLGTKSVRPGAPCLVVRVLHMNTDHKHRTATPAVLETWNSIPSWPNTSILPVGRRVKIQTWASNPNFMIMLYPFRYGDALPATRLSRDRKRLTVVSRGQMDEFIFENEPGEPTRFVLRQTVPGRVDETFRFGFDADQEMDMEIDDMIDGISW